MPLREIATALAEGMYPEVPELGEKTPKPKKEGPKPHISRDLWEKWDDPLDAITRQDIERLSIEECYQVLEFFL